MDNPSLCSPEATCVSVGENIFACVCNEGYTGDGANCKRRPKYDANFLLVNQGMATHRIPFAPTQQQPGYPIYIDYKQMAIALDIDCSDGKAYSSDITGNRLCFALPAGPFPSKLYTLLISQCSLDTLRLLRLRQMMNSSSDSAIYCITNINPKTRLRFDKIDRSLIRVTLMHVAKAIKD